MAVVLVVVGVLNYLYVWRGSRDTPTRADAVVVIGGDDQEGRYQLAMRLVGEGYAPLLVSDLQRYPSPHCHSAGVLCIHPLPFTTRGEARAIATLARQRGWHTVLLVVSRDQAARARLRFTRCWAGDLRVLTVPAGNVVWATIYQDAAFIKAEVWQRGC